MRELCKGIVKSTHEHCLTNSNISTGFAINILLSLENPVKKK